jgi:hypothetical protein
LIDQLDPKDRFRKIAHGVGKNKKRIQTDNCIKSVEENVKEQNIRNA